MSCRGRAPWPRSRTQELGCDIPRWPWSPECRGPRRCLDGGGTAGDGDAGPFFLEIGEQGVGLRFGHRKLEALACYQLFERFQELADDRRAEAGDLGKAPSFAARRRSSSVRSLSLS